MVVKLSSSKMANRLLILLNSLILKIPKQHFYCSFADVDSRAVLLAASWCYFFVNALPLVFVELKNAIIKIEEAVNKNLTDYKKDIPNLFAFNQICVLSNGLETRLGAWNADFEFFFEWLKVESENEKPNRKDIKER